MKEEKLMPLTSAIQQWMSREGWEDSIDINDERTTSVVNTSMTIDDQDYEIFIEAFETDERVFIYLYTPYKVQIQRMAVMARVMNKVNSRLGFGRIACQDDSEARRIQFKISLDVEGSSLSPVQIHTMLSMGVATFRTYGSLLVGAAMTKRSLEEIWFDFLSDQGETGCSSSCSVSRVLQ